MGIVRGVGGLVVLLWVIGTGLVTCLDVTSAKEASAVQITQLYAGASFSILFAIGVGVALWLIAGPGADDPRRGGPQA